MSVTNTSGAASDAVIYRAADCYLHDNDKGCGEYDPSGQIIVSRAPDAGGDHSSAGRTVAFVPLTAGSNYMYGPNTQVWEAVGSQQPFEDKIINGDELLNNGMGFS